MVSYAGELRDVGGDADVDDVYGGAGVARDRVDRGSARGEVRDHLRGDFLGPGCDARSDDAVIAGEDGNRGTRRNRRRARRGDRREPGAERLQPTERSARLG